MSEKLTTIPLESECVSWEGAISIEKGDGWLMPWRIPVEQKDLFPPKTLQDRAACPAGVRLSFCSDTDVVEMDVEPLPAGNNIDCVCEGEICSTVAFEQGQTEIVFEGLPAKVKRIEIYLSHVVPTQVRSIRLRDGASLSPISDTRKRWITYGSSISHCGAAASPAQTWPALAARSQDVHLTCLGYGGNCHAEPMIARMIRDLPADFISLKMGINILGSGSLNPRTFQAAIIGFVQIVREKHADIPMAVISPIISPPREETENVVGLNLQKMRAEIEDAVKKMRAHGDEKLFYVNGLDIMGPDEAHHLPDALHPDAEGYRVMAKNFEQVVFSRVQM